MRLKSYTDFALRVLMHLAARPDQLASIGEIARTYRISHNHLMKVAHDLRKEGFIEAVRGRSGGIRLAKPAEQISVGDVVRHTEDGFDLVDCGTCVIGPACSLTAALRKARAAFMEVLDGYSLADLVADRQSGLRRLLAEIEKNAAPAEAA